MSKGPGRRHSQTTHVAKLRWNAAKQSRVVETRIVPPCRRKRLTRFCGPNYAEIPQPFVDLAQSFQCYRLNQIVSWQRRIYLASFLDAAISAAVPAEDADVCMYGSASVVARDWPRCHGINVKPSGRLPSLRERPVGSFATGILADANAREIMLLTVAWWLVIRLGALLHTKAWRPHTGVHHSTCDPQRQVCAAHY